MDYVDPEVIINRHLSDDQLLDITAQCLRILEDRLDNKQTIQHQQVRDMESRRQTIHTIRMVRKQCHDLVSSGKAQGFVFGLITGNKTWTASSDNLFKWWEEINFEQNGLKALVPVVSESLGLEALKNLQDSTLSSIISALMPHCTPSQRVAPFSDGTPVSWWPKGTEEWWPRLNFLRDSVGPPKYKKPHDLGKNSKIAVIVAIIKNLEPNFSQIRRLVTESITVQSKMNHKENHIWLAVLRGEEMQMSSGIESDSPAVTDGNVKVENVDIGDKVGEGESGRANKKRVAGDEVIEVNLKSSTSSCSQGSISENKKSSEVAAANSLMGRNLKEVSIAKQEPVYKNIIPTICQVKDTARDCKDIRKQKLEGVLFPEPKRLKLPQWNNPLCFKTYSMQGSMNGEVQVKTNNNASNQSSTVRDHFDQSFASLTCTIDQENFNFYNSITLERPSNPSYNIEQGKRRVVCGFKSALL